MTFASFVELLVGLINTAIGVLIGVAMLIFFAGCIQYIYKSSSPKSKKYGRDMILWGLLSLFVMVSMWGIIALLQRSFLP